MMKQNPIYPLFIYIYFWAPNSKGGIHCNRERVDILLERHNLGGLIHGNGHGFSIISVIWGLPINEGGKTQSTVWEPTNFELIANS